MLFPNLVLTGPERTRTDTEITLFFQVLQREDTKPSWFFGRGGEGGGNITAQSDH